MKSSRGLVSRCRFQFLCSTLALFAVLFSARSATPLDAPVYQVGETARVDVISTFAFVVIDPEKTDALKQKEAQRIPVIYRWNTNAVQDAIDRLRSLLATNHEDFMVALEGTFNRPTLGNQAVTNQRFRRFVSSFQNAHKGFPLSSNLARAWALGQPDGEFTAPLEERLQVAMARPLRPDEQPNEAKIGWQVKLVPSDATSALAALDVNRARAIARSNVIALTKFRQEFRNEFLPPEKPLGRFLAPFIRPNCFPEAALTREAREKAIGNISSINRYEPGDVIVRAGDVVTAGSKAALDEFRARLAMLRGPEPVAIPVPPSPSIVPWVWAAGATVLALSTALFFWRRSRRQFAALALVPESLGHDAVLALRNDPVIRARLLEHLTRLLGHSVVQRLFAQRGQLLGTQQTAIAQTAELEERLEKVRTNMQERFHAYEQRIADLEKELAAAEEQNRDLIRAKIALAKQELEAERARNPADWN